MAKLSAFIGSRRRLLCVFIFSFGLWVTISFVSAQGNSTFRGKVIDERTDEAIIGASILVKNAKATGTITDIDGNFTLSLPSLPITIAVSYIGYKSQEIDIYEKPGELILISLAENLNTLNEVVVVGYGTQKRSDVTGAISSISGNDLKKTPMVSFDNGLKGKSAGVQITSSSGEPGASASIRVRGSNSINTGSEPLYVIDGFPVYNDIPGYKEAQKTGNSATLGPKLNALSLINPNDIVSIEILKDASAEAIYGARGANGVVIVTTKKGKNGQASIEFNTSLGIQKVRKTLPLLNASEYAQLVNDANGKDVFTSEQIRSFGEGTNWQNEIFREAPVQNYQLSASGGNERARYSGSLNYYDQQGIIIHSDFKRYAGRFNFEANPTKKISFGWNLSVANVSANQAFTTSGGGEGTQGVVVSALDFSPILSIYDENGEYVMQNDRGIPIGNPVATAKELTNYTSTYRTIGNLFAGYQFMDGLTFKTSLGIDNFSNREKYYAPRTTLAGYGTQGLAKILSNNSLSWLSENTLSFDKAFEKHSFKALAGFTAQKYKREQVYASASGFINDILKADNLGAGSNINAPSSSFFDWALLSYLGRINYVYDSKYLLTLTARADGSSKFGENHKYGFFPSGAVAWKLSEESFIKDLNFFDELKLRLSHGLTGNQEIGSYQSLASLSNMSYIIGDQVVKGFSPANIPNKDLKWETTAQTDIGLDVSLFENRLRLSADAYYKKTTDMLLFINVPYSTGFSTALQNIGSLSNKGIEFAFNAAVLSPKSPLQWDVNFNIAFNRNKVLDLGPVERILTGEINGFLKISDPIIIEAGQPLNSFYGYVSDGIFQTTDDIASSPQATAQPGDRKYKDTDGNGTIDAKDRTFIGNANPKHFGGFINDFHYKQFDLTASFNWVYGNSILNSTRTDLDLPTGQKNSSARVKDRWTPTHPSHTIPRANVSRAFLFSDAQIEDGSYLRLGTLALSYNFSKKALASLHISNLKLTATATNLFTLTHYTGYDPEVNQFGQDNVLRGIDSDAYPTSKQYSLGVNIIF
ncbi:Outer membrane cobalamin receptor protein, SusC/RagA family [Bacteroidales bacterium Barb7]|nr:Outer membrane cobalamin receptor protein, SusC/RagA family [Bacteroidales bacterium Barb7]